MAPQDPTTPDPEELMPPLDSMRTAYTYTAHHPEKVSGEESNLPYKSEKKNGGRK